MSSERITWETCPRCDRTAAVGWLDGALVEFDCPSACTPTEQDMGRVRRLPGGTLSVVRWAPATLR
jgi:hypothetical protein